MTLPRSHPQRRELNDEVHARPPEPMQAPLRLSHLALFTGWPLRDEDLRPVALLAERFGVAPPAAGSNHFSRDLGPFRIKWERHTEFARYTFIAPGAAEEDPFGRPVVDLVPADWLQALPGEVIYAAHAVLLAAEDGRLDRDPSPDGLFAGNELVGSEVAAGGGVALTDFRVHGDGFNRLLLRNHRMSKAQAGRQMQRLLEIDIYRIMAMMALPVARELTPFLSQADQELAQITGEMQQAASERSDAQLLQRLTRLEAAIESRHAETHARFSAAKAYYDIVCRRTAELREQRIRGLQTFGEFVDRRLAPAMSTCTAVAQRQEALSKRVARASQLLAARVAVAREDQTRLLLQSMNNRARLQLRLQETVEGLSVAAITYYIVGLVAYAIKGLVGKSWGLSPELLVAASIPPVLAGVIFGLRRVRRLVAQRK